MTFTPFSYFGTKQRIASRYPPPKHRTIVEPFAGAAGYACRYPQRDVILVDKYDAVVGVWEYLIRTKPSEILSLPVLRKGERIDGLQLCQEAKWLLGFWANSAIASPRRTVTSWGASAWNERRRFELATFVTRIRHWKVIRGNYAESPNVEATWYVDPPYEAMGHHYKEHTVDYAALGRWCEQLKGQVIVCENEGATWLPFAPLCVTNGQKRSSVEVMWYRP